MTEIDYDGYALIVASEDAQLEALDRDAVRSLAQENDTTVCQYFEAQCFFVLAKEAARAGAKLREDGYHTASFEFYHVSEVIADYDAIEPFTSYKAPEKQQALRDALRQFVDERKTRIRRRTLDLVWQLRPVQQTVALLNGFEFNGDLDYGIHLDDVAQAPWAIWLSCCENIDTTVVIHPSGYVIEQGTWDDDSKWVYTSIADWLLTLTCPDDPDEVNEELVKGWLREFEEKRDGTFGG